MVWRGLIHEYRTFMPPIDPNYIVSLNEGGTPLVYAERLSKQLGLEIYLKLDGLNPTGSFKDRGMTVAVSMAKQDGMTSIICASTGNTSASAAAYAARAGMKCTVVLPDGGIAMGKLAQALVHGARVVAINGNFDCALSIVRDLCNKHPIALVNSVNPYRLEGQKTGAFEIVDSLGRVPDYLAIPVGNAGNISAYWKGFKEYRNAGKADAAPRLLGFQAEGAAPMVLGRPVENPVTIATAIKIGNPASWDLASQALEESSGSIDSVTDEEILQAYNYLASSEGVFAEPASCASIAGLFKTARAGLFSGGETVVAVLTGNGLKDPDRAILQSPPITAVDPDFTLVEKAVLR